MPDLTSSLSSESAAAAAETVAPGGRPRKAGAGVILGALLRRQIAQTGTLLPLVIIIQALMAAGIVIGFGFLIPDLTAETALFLSTGAPTILMFAVGLVIVPQSVARSRTDGTFEHLRSLPVARPLLLVAELLVWTAIALPGLVIGVLVGRLRYDLALSLDWPVLIGTALLVTVMATAVGYAIAVSLQPALAQLASQMLVFFVLLFSPITFPAAQLPQWFQSVHDVLPIRPGADLLRAGLAAESFTADGRDLLVLTLWCALGVAVTLRALMRRG